MKKYLPILVFIIIYLFFPSKTTALDSQSIQSIEINTNLSNTNDIEVTQNFTLRGDSNNDLSSGIVIELPFDLLEIKNVKINGNNHDYYNVVERKVYISLQNIFLKVDESVNIDITYVVKNFITEKYFYKILNFPSPTNSQYEYNIEINDPGSKYSMIYTNTIDQQLPGKLSSDLQIIWERNDITCSSINMAFPKVNSDTYFPVISDNTGFIVKVNKLSNVRDGYADEEKNYFLLQNGDNQITLDFTLIPHSQEIDSLPFKDIQTNITGNSISEIENNIISNYSPNLEFDLNNFQLNSLGKNESMSDIEYAILTSSSLSKLNIPNRIVYGISFHPELNQSIHYWVEVNIDNKTTVIDTYFKDLFQIDVDSKIDYPKLAFGVLSDNNIYMLNSIENLSLLTINSFSVNDCNNNLDNSGLNIGFNLHFDNNVYFSYINHSDYFSYITESTNSEIYSQLKHILILPKSGAEQKIFKSAQNQKVSFNIKYKTSTFEPIQLSFTIQTIENRLYIFRLFIIIFAITSLVIILFKIFLLFIKPRLTIFQDIKYSLHMIKNKNSNRIST